MGILHGICWDIWHERNTRIFNGVKRSPSEVGDSIQFEVAPQAVDSKDFAEYL